MTDESRVAEHVTRTPPTTPPPCAQRCWEPVGPGWVFTRARHCVHDPEAKKWTECEDQ